MIVSWLLIALCVFYIVRRDDSVLSGAGHALEEKQSPGMPMIVPTRYAIGVGSLMNSGQNVTRSLLITIRRAAVTPSDKVRVSAAIAELDSPAAALAYLARLQRTAPQPVQGDIHLFEVAVGGKGQTLSPRTRAEFIERDGWFARLALAQGLARDDPGRAWIDREGLTTVSAIAAAFILGGAGFIAGIILLILLLLRIMDRRFVTAYAPTRAAGWPTAPYVEGFAIYLLLMVGVGILFRAAGWNLPLPAQGPLLLAVALGAACWPLARGVKLAAWRDAVGWRVGRGVLREMGAGVSGYIAAIPLMALAYGVVLYLNSHQIKSYVHPIMYYLTGSGWQIASLYFIAAIVAPVAEETMFRGMLFHHLRRPLHWFFAAVVVSVIFAIIHPEGVATMPLLAMIGFALAGLREWRGSIISCMTAHSLHNALTLTFALMLFR